MPAIAAACIFGALIAINLASRSQIPDPNDPLSSTMSADVLAKNLTAASDFVNERSMRGEISTDEGRELLSEYAKNLTSAIDLKDIDKANAWRYGDLFRTGRQWKMGKAAYQLAVSKPATEDRRVNDTLRLAQCMAELGEVSEAIETARKVFDAEPKQSAPIPPAVLLEIAPPARGKGFDRELAQLLVDASEKHLTVVVDPKKAEAVAFKYAQPHHIKNAMKLAAKLYEDLDDGAAVVRTLEKLDSMVRDNKVVR